MVSDRPKLTTGMLQWAGVDPVPITVRGNRVRLGQAGRWLSAQQSRMVLRGQVAGYQEGRHHAVATCPYPDDGRPRRLWMTGWNTGRHMGLADLIEVRASYRQGLAVLDNPPEPAYL